MISPHETKFIVTIIKQMRFNTIPDIIHIIPMWLYNDRNDYRNGIALPYYEYTLNLLSSTVSNHMKNYVLVGTQFYAFLSSYISGCRHNSLNYHLNKL